MAKTYTLTIIIGDRLSAPNKRSVRRNCILNGLKHDNWRAASSAAAALSKLNAVREVHIHRVDKEYLGVWRCGQRRPSG